VRPGDHTARSDPTGPDGERYGFTPVRILDKDSAALRLLNMIDRKGLKVLEID